MSASEDTQSKSPSELANLALALSRHGVLPSSKLIAGELSSAMAEVARKRDWDAFQGALSQVRSDLVASEALLAAGHLVVSHASLSEPQAGSELSVELVALPVVVEAGSEVQFADIARGKAIQQALEGALSSVSRVQMADTSLSEAGAFASPERAQQFMDRLLAGDSVASMRAADTRKKTQPRSKGELRFVPGVLIHEGRGNPWRGRLTSGLREKLTEIADARLRQEGQTAGLRFGELSRWVDARREGHALHQALKIELELLRACDKAGVSASDLRVQLSATESPCSLTICFGRQWGDGVLLRKRLLSWSEPYCADLVREFARLAFTHGMAIRCDEQTSGLVDACMSLSAVPQMVKTLVTRGRCFLGPESSMLQ